MDQALEPHDDKVLCVWITMSNILFIKFMVLYSNINICIYVYIYILIFSISHVLLIKFHIKYYRQRWHWVDITDELRNRFNELEQLKWERSALTG